MSCLCSALMVRRGRLISFAPGILANIWSVMYFGCQPICDEETNVFYWSGGREYRRVLPSLECDILRGMEMRTSMIKRLAVAALAVAVPLASVSVASAQPTVNTSVAHVADRSMEDRLALATEQDSAEEVSRTVFPDDDEAQLQLRGYIQEAELQAGAVDSPVGPQALPALIAPLVPAIGLCVAGAIGGAGVNEIVSLVRHGENATAEARVDSAIGGCITTVVPPFLRGVANAAKDPLIKATMAIIIRWNT